MGPELSTHTISFKVSPQHECDALWEKRRRSALSLVDSQFFLQAHSFLPQSKILDGSFFAPQEVREALRAFGQLSHPSSCRRDGLK
ncbi:hypothetical protein EYF80_034994 [Liparis tanakae]|uniref:Uncharacterized protein n=1 Tax=Liparis tanakae TaxID=230148 RepID=A0A4Z2GMC9_9TELE|nr:hypothetical protein EYF80_034994 [Liparis tanakae]